MKVKELLEKMKDVDPEKEIYVRYYCGDWDGCATLEDYWLWDMDRNILVEESGFIIDISDLLWRKLDASILY